MLEPISQTELERARSEYPFLNTHEENDKLYGVLKGPPVFTVTT